jgi:hypothetical protein
MLVASMAWFPPALVSLSLFFRYRIALVTVSFVVVDNGSEIDTVVAEDYPKVTVIFPDARLPQRSRSGEVHDERRQKGASLYYHRSPVEWWRGCIVISPVRHAAMARKCYSQSQSCSDASQGSRGRSIQACAGLSSLGAAMQFRAKPMYLRHWLRQSP